ncbi:hypothetical protein PAEPH01_1942 [Pancytospora epiphaga]|nr:hypothetical protein PAEPH01_1942 [Pancytospora epiphaga]
MVREAFKRRIKEPGMKLMKKGQIPTLLHTYRVSMIYGLFDFQEYRPNLLGAFIYSFGLNVIIVSSRIIVELFEGKANIDRLEAIISVSTYTLGLLLYCVPVSYLHTMAIPYIPFSTRLTICMSSLGYIPVLILLSSIKGIRPEYLIIGLLAYSSSFIGKNTIQRKTEVPYVFRMVYTVFVVLTQYLCIHGYKNTLFFSTFHFLCSKNIFTRSS